jgi:hypothetical protein
VKLPHLTGHQIERFFNTLKTEFISQQTYATRAQAKSAIFEYIEVFYTVSGALVRMQQDDLLFWFVINCHLQSLTH